MDVNDGNLWKETRRITKQVTTIPPLTNGDRVAETDTDKSELIATHLKRVFTPNNPGDHTTEESVAGFSLDSDASVEYPIIFTHPTEIKTSIMKLANHKAPGEDLIPNVVLKNLPNKGIAFLTGLFNACLRHAHFPSQWKNAIITVFHKPGKPRNQPSSYRPISLLNTLSKLLERIIYNRILGFININLTIPSHQFGFRPKHSSTHQLQRVAELLVGGFENKKYTLAAFIDVAAAFDTVWHAGLEYKLHSIGLPRYLRFIISSFLSQRTFQVRINSSTSLPKQILAGVPQGAILSPILFNLYCYDIPDSLPATLATYADDAMIAVQNYDLSEGIDNLQYYVDQLTAWYTTWRLKLNATKTEVKIFALRHIPDSPQKKISIMGTEILWTGKHEAVKYLGVHLDTRLTWNTHIKNKLTLANIRLRQLYPILNKQSPLQHKCATLIYTSLLRPLISYACPVWLGTSKSNMKKIESFQNKVLRLAARAPWFVRNSQIRRELGVPKFQEFLHKLTTRFRSGLQEVPAAITYRLGHVTANRRLRPRLYQDAQNDDFSPSS